MTRIGPAGGSAVPRHHVTPENPMPWWRIEVDRNEFSNHWQIAPTDNVLPPAYRRDLAVHGPLFDYEDAIRQWTGHAHDNTSRLLSYRRDLAVHGPPDMWGPNLLRRHRCMLGLSHAEIDDIEADLVGAAWPDARHDRTSPTTPNGWAP